MAFLLQREDGFTHQMEGSDGMLETGVLRRRVNHIGHTELFDAGESLHQRVLYDIEQQASWYLDKTENRVVDDLCVIHIAKIRINNETTKFQLSISRIICKMQSVYLK